MRFISMHKATRDTEAGVPPRPEVIAGMGELMKQMAMAGVLRDGAGLHASARGVRITLTRGKRSVKPGPFKGEHELVAGYLQMLTKTFDEAIDWAARWGTIFGDGEIDLRPMVEPWDIGMAPKPEGPRPTRYMATRKADRKPESVPTPAQGAEQAKLLDHMKKAGVLIGCESLAPSANALRINYRGGKRVVTDGPFTETKELIAGYCIYDAGGRDEVLEWSDRFARAFGEDVELDVRTFA